MSDLLNEMPPIPEPLAGVTEEEKRFNEIAELSKNGVVVMGNEGNGISYELKQICNSKLLIPNYPKGRKTSESLNVGIATAVICAEFRRPR